MPTVASAAATRRPPQPGREEAIEQRRTIVSRVTVVGHPHRAPRRPEHPLFDLVVLVEGHVPLLAQLRQPSQLTDHPQVLTHRRYVTHGCRPSFDRSSPNDGDLRIPARHTGRNVRSSGVPASRHGCRSGLLTAISSSTRVARWMADGYGLVHTPRTLAMQALDDTSQPPTGRGAVSWTLRTVAVAVVAPAARSLRQCRAGAACRHATSRRSGAIAATPVHDTHEALHEAHHALSQLIEILRVTAANGHARGG